MTKALQDDRARRAKYRRARIRNFLFTVGPNRLSGGRLSKRHLGQDIVVREIEIFSPRWPRELDGMRIGHVSDFHLGELLPLERAMEIVRQLGELEPDLIACTGDVVDLHHHEAMPLLKAMAEAGAPMGAALVLGNHDELHCGDTLARHAERAGMIVLRNDAVEIHRNGTPFVLSGIDWAKSTPQCAKLVEKACGDESHLLLSHNPKAFSRASEIGVPLTLSGHTHGGQVALKAKPNTNLAIAHRQSAGLFEEGPSRLYVTTGIGAWFPLRVNCPAEIAMITMRSSDGASPADQIRTPGSFADQLDSLVSHDDDGRRRA